MQLAWLTDIHLNMVERRADRLAFYKLVRSAGVDAVLLGGDIGEATTVCGYLQEMEKYIGCRIYFVLGNHDYYRGSVSQVDLQVSNLARRSEVLFYLPAEHVVALDNATALIGHGGWCDGRLGDFMRSDTQLNDYVWIQDFNPSVSILSDGSDSKFAHPRSTVTLSDPARQKRLKTMQTLADRAADHIHRCLEKAMPHFERIIVLTHVPPLPEPQWLDGILEDHDRLPHYSCKVAGEVLVKAARENPDKRFDVYCGHVHSSGRVQISENLIVNMGESVYGYPEVQMVLEI